jgi:hypothetical protein
MVARGRRQEAARSKPRIAPNICQAPTAVVRRWFDDALGKDDPKPSRAACERLAREFQIIINRQNNAELKSNGPVPLAVLKDVSLPEELNKRVRKVMDGAKQMLAEMRELEDFAGGYQWGAVSLEDVKDVLQRIILSPEASAALVTQTFSFAPSQRRRRERWHAAGREMARLIKAAMRDVNYRGRLDDDEESVIAKVGAAAINWAYAISPKIGPAGFASAMKERSRSSETKRIKRLTDEERFNEQFPGAARIKIVD